MRPPFLLVASPVTGDTSSGDKSRLQGAGLLAGCSQHPQAAPGNEVVLVPSGVSRTLVPLDGALVLQISVDNCAFSFLNPDQRSRG